MKSSTLVLILALQAILIIGLYEAIADVHGVGESKAIDINPNPLKCCHNCNFTFSGLYHCEDIVKKCDRNCRQCLQVQPHPPKFRCNDTFLGMCPTCKP